MDFNKSITYSFLAYHNNNNKDIMRVFIPLIKKSFLKFENKNGKFYGDLTQVKKTIKEEFKLDIPITMLKRIVELVAEDYPSIHLYSDNNIKLTEQIVFEYDSILAAKAEEIERINEDYKNFLDSEEIEKAPEIMDFIENNKSIFCELINGNNCRDCKEEYTPVARYINQIKKDKDKFKIIEEIYLGSIISCYISTDISDQKLDKKIKLVLDTNFIVSLMGLHSEESNITCKQLYDIANVFGFEFIVLDITLAETKHLLFKKAYDLGEIKQGIFVEDDFLSTCLKKDINKTDLQRKARKLRTNLETEFSLRIIEIDDKFKNEARRTKLYKELRKRNFNREGAEHDAVAILYTKKLRNEKVEKFEQANAWFLQDQRGYRRSLYNNDGQLRLKITASLLLNILWLANPAKSSNLDDFARVNLLELVQVNLADVLPDNKEINELRENMIKYQGEIIEDEEVAFLAQSISSRSLLQKEAKSLNIAAKISDNEFRSNLDQVMDSLEKREEQKYEMKNKEIDKKAELLLQEKKKRSRLLKARLKKIGEELEDLKNKEKLVKDYVGKRCRINLGLAILFLGTVIFSVFWNDRNQIIRTNYYLKLLGIFFPVTGMILTKVDFFKMFFISGAENNYYLETASDKFNYKPEKGEQLRSEKEKLGQELEKLEG